MGRMPQLENFERAEPGASAMAGPSEDWRDGHATGFEEGLARAAAAQDQLSAEIAQTLADMAFGYAEARAHVLQSLKPLFGALISRVLPPLTDAAHSAHVIGLLQAAAEQDSALPLELSVHPSRSQALSALLPYAVGLPIILVADPSIGSDVAILKSVRGETALDLDAVITAAKTALGAIFATDEERANYG